MQFSRTPSSARLVLVAGAVALVAAACGGSSDVGVSSRTHQEVSTTSSSLDSTTSTSLPTTTVPTTTAPAPTTPLAPGMQFVTAQGVRLQVPASWPVYDLTSDTKRCVLANANAAFLGHQGKNASCPADASGRTETVQIEPLDAETQARGAEATAPSTINGVVVRTDPQSSTARTLTVAVPDRSALITITYRNDATVANRILSSLEHAG